MTGSSSKERFELYGCIEIAPGKPSFALPVFRSSAGSKHGQVIDELSGNIVAFRIIDTEDLLVFPISSTQVFSAGDGPAYCILMPQTPHIGGSLSKLRSSITPLVDREDFPVAFRIQASNILGLENEKFLRRTLSWKIESESAPASRAYQRSVARTILWRELIRSAKDGAVAERTLRLRPQLDVDVNSDGSLKLHLSTLSASDYPAINFDTLPTAIEIELGLAAPSNDDSHFEQPQEQLFAINVKELQHFMDKKLGSDGRISAGTYRWTAELLRSLGFRNLDQVENAISGYGGARLSYVAAGNLQGQATKLEFMLLAAMGGNYTARHPWGKNLWFQSRNQKILDDFAKAKIPIKDFDPTSKLSQGA